MIVSLDDSAARDSRVCGGKAAALADLIAAGFPVPPGFVVTTPNEPDLPARILPEVFFAVRSSGFSEDSTQSSFAGQYETVLGVKGIAAVSGAIARCFASFSNSRSAAYRQSRSESADGGAVIVQRLIEAEAAGVAFTVDPVSGAADRVCIEANFGLGDSVVGGQVNADGFTVLKTSGEIAQRRIGRKEVHSILGPEGVRLQNITEDLVLKPSVSDEVIRGISALAVKVEQHHRAPVDIEWALKDGILWLLQARPVTTRPSLRAAEIPADWVPELNTRIDPRFPLYSRGNVSEILPGCVTPLTYSLFSRGVEHAFRNIAESIGSMKDVGPDPIVVGFFYHRVYLNVSYFMTAADNSPGATRDTVHEDLIGPPETRHPAWTVKDFLPWNLVRGARMITRYLALQGRLEKEIAACRSLHENRRKLFDRPDADWSDDELARWFDPSDKDAFIPPRIHIQASQFATSSFGTLRGMTKRWLNDSDGALASMLVTGIGSIASANPASAIYDMSRMVLADPSLLAVFEAEADDERLLSRISGPFRKVLDDFLSRFGHRGFREAELRYPCWRDRPAAVLTLVRQQLGSGTIAPQFIAQRQAEVSAAARKRALSGMSGLRQKSFIPVLEFARKNIAAREEMKDVLLLFMYLVRKVIVLAQKRLQNVFESPDDIYFLVCDEVASALRGQLDAGEIRRIVERRRRDFEWSSRIYVPKLQDGVAKRFDRPDTDSTGSVLTGIPVSPGRVEGLARVVLDPTNATIAPGEILVAPVTDVAWTPLFLTAAGLIVETGGPLSHGSIVAREYGIPAVTGVAHATLRIRTGAWVQMDGDHGVVTVIREA